ncbi:hypothetical protein DFP97_105216 [Paenibacillus prosopidis]|uniref:Uncharacterized protein n=1 Tax=Paenibacillus prosopidis TaxID=630520 RepID=A0A368W4F6_9BACL|nr:hypothetical protein DFP97_105216 [Paenibacillus prosopidis]
MERLDSISSKLIDYFKINELDKDPSFSKIIPRVVVVGKVFQQSGRPDKGGLY